MDGIQFEWDPAKSRSNQRKQGVSFEEAQSVFFDDNALLLDALTIPRRTIGSFFSA